MKKNAALFCLLATSLVVSTIAVGCDDGNGWVATDDATIGDEVADIISCPSGLVLRVSDGKCVPTTEDVVEDDTTSDVVEEVSGDACTEWSWLEGTEWVCGPGGPDGFSEPGRMTLWVDAHDDTVCVMEFLSTYTDGTHLFSRNLPDGISLAPDHKSFTTDSVYYSPCVLKAE